MLINTGNISRKVLSKVLRSFDKNFERLQKDEWSVNFIVKNINTGYELVNVNYPQEEWEISSEMWDE